MSVCEVAVEVVKIIIRRFCVALYFTPLAFQACGNPLNDVGDHAGSNKALFD